MMAVHFLMHPPLQDDTMRLFNSLHVDLWNALDRARSLQRRGT